MRKKTIIICLCKKRNGIKEKAISFLLVFMVQYGLCENPFSGKCWTSTPFENKAFIENKGQYDGITESLTLPWSQILFATSINEIDVFFQKNGIVYRYSKRSLSHKKKSGEEPYIEHRFVYMKWLNSNPDVKLIAEEKTSYYHTFPGTPNDISTGITACAYKKITYKDLYPGIDVEYIFSEKKGGIKYNLIVHSGANLSLVKMKYDGVANIKTSVCGDIIITSGLDTIITDHQPNTFYQINHVSIRSFYIVENNIVSFGSAEYDITKTMIVDPWQTYNPPIAFGAKAYDINYDLNGNVYVLCNGSTSTRLMKLNNTGTLQWIYNAPSGFGGGAYGDFVVDEVSGSCYIVEGVNTGSGARVVKVFPSGIQGPIFPGNANMREMWRAEYSRCLNKIVVGGGGTNSGNSACVLDTDLVNITPVNVLGTSLTGHDVSLLAIDPYSPFCYMLYAKEASSALFDNYLVKCPVPALTPASYIVPTGYTFQEIKSVRYTGGTGTTQNTNAMNGIAVSPNWLYLYDGATLKKFNKTTGALVSSASITSTNFGWGGIAVDACDNIYIGINGNDSKASQTYFSPCHIGVFNASLIQTNTISIPNSGNYPNYTIYDLKLGPNNKLYACGFWFVAELDLPPVKPVISLSKTASSKCYPCDGSATISSISCDSTANYNYSWSSGQNIQTATGLCPGTYTVTASGSCSQSVTTTFVITGPICGSITATTGGANVCMGNCATVTSSAINGTAPYTYSWSTGATTQNINPCPPVTTTYTVTVTDSGGNAATSTAVVTVNNITAQYTKGTANCSNCGCKEWIMITGINGTPPYTYQWPNGYDNRYKNALCPGVYNVIVTDNNGCKTTVKVNAP